MKMDNISEKIINFTNPGNAVEIKYYSFVHILTKDVKDF